MKILAITQARTGSKRLPNKVLMKINGKTLLDIQIERLVKSTRISQLVVATTILEEDDPIIYIAEKNSIPHYRGSITNVLERFYNAARPYSPDWIVRITSDCPLIDPKLIDQIIDFALNNNVDYCSNTLDPTFPDGMDVEIFRFAALEEAWQKATLKSDKEHVTPYIYRNSTFNKNDNFTSVNYYNDDDFSSIRLTVDEISDFQVIKNIIKNLGANRDWLTYAKYYITTPMIQKLNKSIDRNEGFRKSLKEDRE